MGAYGGLMGVFGSLCHNRKTLIELKFQDHLTL